MESITEIIDQILAIIPENETELRELLVNNRACAEQSPESMHREWLNTIYENLHISIFRHWNSFSSEAQRMAYLKQNHLEWQNELWLKCSHEWKIAYD